MIAIIIDIEEGPQRAEAIELADKLAALVQDHTTFTADVWGLEKRKNEIVVVELERDPK